MRKPNTKLRNWLSDEIAATAQGKALVDVIDERLRQLTKWGEQIHPFGVWLLILAEEIGEVVESLHHGIPNPNEVVQVAAVAMAMVESEKLQDEGKEETTLYPHLTEEHSNAFLAVELMEYLGDLAKGILEDNPHSVLQAWANIADTANEALR